MNPEFWQTRWQEKRIGFHQSEVNPLLTKYFSALNLSVGGRVLVPLCGKSVDMIWLARKGYEVVGIELVESAVQAFFIEQDIAYTVTAHTKYPNIKCYQGQVAEQAIELWAADIFALKATDIGDINAVYDRAALIAMPADMRPKYSEQIRKLSHNASQLLITLNYDQSKKNSPPFSISHEQLCQYYDADYKIIKLEGQSSTLNAAADIAVMEEIWLLQQT